MGGCTRTRPLIELALSGLMERLVVLSRPPFLILQVRPHRIVVAVLGSREIAAASKSDLTPGADGCAKLRFVWHNSPIAAARSALRLSRAASVSGKGPALMGLGGDARVQSILRAANRTDGAEDTR
jgi:hypothetical protein